MSVFTGMNAVDPSTSKIKCSNVGIQYTKDWIRTKERDNLATRVQKQLCGDVFSLGNWKELVLGFRKQRHLFRSGYRVKHVFTCEQSSKVKFAEMEVRGSVSSEYQLSDQDTDGELEPMSVQVLFDNLCMSTELVEEFEASLTTGLSEAVAAIQTLLKFIRNCEGVCVFYGHTWISIYTYVCLITVFHVFCMMWQRVWAPGIFYVCLS